MSENYRVLVTGSRDWTNKAAIFEGLDYAYLNRIGVGTFVLIHGAARGADSLAQDWFVDRKSIGWRVEVETYPADWSTFGKRAGILRNIEMVKAGANLCLAFPLGESKGTRHCISAARLHYIPVVIVDPVTKSVLPRVSSEMEDVDGRD